MRLIVVDASAVAGGPVTRAIECAARECVRVGAIVTSVRLYSLYSACCVTCGDCRRTGRCARRHPLIESACAELAGAGSLLVGVASSASQRDPRAETLLRRLVGSFGCVYDSRRGEGLPDGIRQRKVAGLVSSAPPYLGFAAVLGTLPYGLAGVWRVLDRAGVEVVGTAAVARRWSGPASWDVTRMRATRLGRTLAARLPNEPVLRPLPGPIAAPASEAAALISAGPRVA